MEKQHQTLLETARKLGVLVTDVSAEMNCDAAILEFGGRSELVIRGTPTSLLNARAQFYCDNKQLTKEAFARSNIPFPKSVLFKTPEDEAIRTFPKPGKKYVCKPVAGTNGVGVELNIDGREAIGEYWRKNKNLGDGLFMLEEQIVGEDLRVQVVGGKIVAVCTRKPAHITGDGRSTVGQLIEDLRVTVSRQNPANQLWLDQTTDELLARENLTMTAIPNIGREIFLNEVANMARGAVAIDRTEEIHGGFQDWVKGLCDYLNASYFALDIIAPDPQKPPEKNAFALEINARPEWLHHTFSRGKQHDIPAIILQNIFDLGRALI